MSDYSKQLQRVVNDYKQAKGFPAESIDIARWAIATGRYNLRTPALERSCARDISQAMREEFITDKKGRRVRAKHPASARENGETKMLWDDIRSAPREHMVNAFQLRRRHIVGECRQVKTDVDSYNDSHTKHEPIQLVLDFTKDVAEAEALSEIETDEDYELEQAA